MLPSHRHERCSTASHASCRLRHPRDARSRHRSRAPAASGAAGRGAPVSSTVDVLVDRLRDRRSRKVAFVSHCLLNENTRYLGGACRACCVREVVDGLLDRDVGIVQMPCPEQLAWGGVLKRHMLRMYGHPLARALAGIAPWYSR